MWKSLAAFAFALSLGTGCIVDDGAQTYDVCFDTLDCSSAFDFCQSITSSTAVDQICTRNCNFNSDCPFTPSGLPGRCVPLSDGSGICLESCEFDTDCATTFRCDVIDSGDLACVPN
ncbi:MAG: hypothetical protein AAF411_16285 [Myxococcota bacterium]